MTSDHSIPTVNIQPFLDSSASSSSRDAVIEAVRNACMTYGFFQLVGHGIPLELQHQALECAKVFFDLPLDQKQELSMSKAMGLSKRGYDVVGGQQLDADSLPDLKEGFYIGREMPASDPRAGKFLQGPNLWPDLPNDVFRAPIMDYHRRVLDLHHVLLKILALGLPYSAHVFDEFMQEPVANIRLLHYPPQLSMDKKQFGAGAHTDFGCTTILLQQADIPGLEVLHAPTSTWIPVPAIEDTFVVNVGDLLDRWTVGTYRSAVHRVINGNARHRYSIPFFYHGNLATKLAPLDGSWWVAGTGGDADVPMDTVEDHILSRFKVTYSPAK